MASIDNEPRALGAALAGPAFATRTGGLAMHVANRHVERWAPEAGASRVRPLRNLGFVDRMIAPWIETAQRSASLRMFSQMRADGPGERTANDVSWVFPRPWYQDELDWMAAARQAPRSEAVFTTRGTYVAPGQAASLPPALYEFIAPSLSVASTGPQAAGVGFGGGERSEAYSPLVPLAAVQAAEIMQRAVAPTLAGPSARMSPALRDVLSTVLARATSQPSEPSRVSLQAPELVTPPAPRAPIAGRDAGEPSLVATAVADRYAEQRAQIAEVQRIARQAAERELAARAEAARPGVDPRAVAGSEAELRERAGAPSAQARQAEAARLAEQTRLVGAERARQVEAERAAEIARARGDERARVEERIAQRLAERRLHEQARTEAAAHARAPLATPLATEVHTSAPMHGGEERAPAAISAALAALPPELAALIGQRPERALQTIGELGEALRTVELLARGSASGASLEATRGPRLMMPAGIGGLVAAVDRAHAISERPAVLAGERTPATARALATDAIATRTAMPLPATAPSATRAPAMTWMTPPTAYARVAPATALEATAATAPAAIAHVAWADRWLARFAGASQQSLDTLSATAGPSRLQALVDAAPGSVFVAPQFGPFDVERDGNARVTSTLGAPPAATASAANADVVRYADDAETPDDVFAAISAAASRGRAAQTPSAPPQVRVSEQVATLAASDRMMPADAVAHAAPLAPNAGFSAQLASSPFAHSLRHVLPLPSAPAFDVRALFGGGVAATYLAGLLDAGAAELAVPTSLAPAWASWAPALLGDAPTAEGAREVPTWDPTYVAPAATDEAADDAEHAIAGVPARVDAARAEAAIAPLTTLRTALLAWTADATTGAAPTPAAVTATTAAPIATPTARTMIEAMSLPMLGDDAANDAATAWTAPGMVADRAHSWSVAQERSTTDLALDFVPPELVLAARVYGLGPAEAAQAARLALAGPGHLTAMASTVDRTFVQAMAIEAERRERLDHTRAGTPRSGATATTAYPIEMGAAPGGDSTDAAAIASLAPTHTTFGVERRAPRGAFLWPSATVAALGLNAAGPDGQQSMSLAALELLAAQAVAELGTFASLGEPRPAGDAATMVGTPLDGVATPTRSTPSTGSNDAGVASGAEPAEADVLGAATAVIPAARRARFEALYVALSQSPNGRSWSPAARAARALALVGRGEDGATITARERAAAAWDVLPVVYADGDDEPVTASRGTNDMPAVRGAANAARTLADRRDPRAPGMAYVDAPISVDNRPGLGALSARAGEALGSYVAPVAATAEPTSGSIGSSSSGASSREVGAVLRAPTAAQELVRTGRPSGRHGGGEVEIPTWFEAAARKMLEDRSAPSEGISLAELTLVSAAPASQIAASTRTAPSAGPAAPGIASQAKTQETAPGIDIEKIAGEIYRHILVLMDVARARNGEPYL